MAESEPLIHKVRLERTDNNGALNVPIYWYGKPDELSKRFLDWCEQQNAEARRRYKEAHPDE